LDDNQQKRFAAAQGATMKVLICIDDTDNLESRGTGDLAEQLAEEIETRAWGRCEFVTRHQLLVHPDVPYTSHNSSMCFAADLEERHLPELMERAGEFLLAESATGSDPGLAIAIPGRLSDTSALIEFGQRAKLEVLNKQLAYDTAAAHNIHLSEHGGTGQGVIGALAGIGLRLGGNDGRIKGWLEIPTSDGHAKVADIIARFDLGGVRSLAGDLLAEDDLVVVGEKPKAVFLGGKPFLMVSPCEMPGAVRWQTSSRRELKQY
jgi:hypothetical protein